MVLCEATILISQSSLPCFAFNSIALPTVPYDDGDHDLVGRIG